MNSDNLKINDYDFVAVHRYQPLINNFYINDKNFEKETEELLKTYGLDNVWTISDIVTGTDFQGTTHTTLYSVFYINSKVKVVQFNIQQYNCKLISIENIKTWIVKEKYKSEWDFVKNENKFIGLCEFRTKLHELQTFLDITRR